MYSIDAQIWGGLYFMSSFYSNIDFTPRQIGLPLTLLDSCNHAVLNILSHDQTLDVLY